DLYSVPRSLKPQEIGDVPLEVRVEAMDIQPIDLRSKVRIGQKYENLVKSNFPPNESDEFINKLRTEFSLKIEGTPDQKSLGFFNLMAGNVIDGGILWETIQTHKHPKDGFLPLEAITHTLITWYQELFFPAEEPYSWQSRNLVHQFSVHGEKEIELKALDFH